MTQDPYTLLGGTAKINALVETFYDLMSELEPALAQLHACTPDGKVNRGSRDRFWSAGLAVRMITSSSTVIRACACGTTVSP